MVKLLVQKAVAFSELGKLFESLQCWKQASTFASRNLPPNDESLPVFLLQTAVCLMALDRVQEAQAVIVEAVGIHNTAFGGGPYFMALRYQNELLRAPINQSAAIRVWGTIAAMAGSRFRRYK
mmetsp:Transcript_9773/g.12840  ORF Transcript_9773/g.12840 Transcript_9773/m.12840 type:complete len:123 (-) Transcript_9773:96-464(-)